MKKYVILIFLCSYVVRAQEKNVIAPGSNLIIEGIPAIPASINTDVKKYSESRSASLVDLHPLNHELIISTRFGNVAQLHEVKMPMGARKQITFYDEPIGSATYEPINGEYLIFSKDVGGNEFAQLYRYDFQSGNTVMLTDGGRSQNGGIVWSNNGKSIAYASTRRNGTDRDIYIMDPKNPSSDKIVIELSGGGWGIEDWTKDDRQLLLGEYVSINESHYWLVDIATGKKTELTDRKEKGVANGTAHVSKDGKGIYFLTDKENEFQRLAYLDFATKKINYLTKNIPWDVEDFEVSEDGKDLAFIINEAGISKLYFMEVASLKYSQVENLPIGVISGIKFHKKTKELAFTLATSRSSADVYTIKPDTKKIERWTESELGGMVANDLTIPELIKWKSFDNKEISGFYYKPSTKFTGKRPVIINIHGGPEGQFRPSFIGANNYFINELGIAIIFPNVRGSLGYGKTFVTLDNGMKREESVKDIDALITWISKQPDLDANRIMVTGGSYGGYMTLAVATNYNSKIRCSIDIVGISNFNTFLKNTESYRRDLRRVEYGDERDSSMARYFEKIAPLNNSAKITKPLFIVQGGNDPRVPKTEAVQMAKKVKSNGGVVWYLEAKDEGHGFRKKNNIDFQRNATILFIKQYLLEGI